MVFLKYDDGEGMTGEWKKSRTIGTENCSPVHPLRCNKGNTISGESAFPNAIWERGGIPFQVGVPSKGGVGGC